MKSLLLKCSPWPARLPRAMGAVALVFAVLLQPFSLCAQSALKTELLQLDTTLTPDPVSTEQNYFGSAVAMEDDVAAVTQQRYVYIYRDDGTTWHLEQVLDAGTTCRSLALADGYLVLGLPEYLSSTGKVEVYTFNEVLASWNLVKTLTASDGIWEYFFGNSVDIDSGVIVVGAYRNSTVGNQQGKVYAYAIPDIPTDGWPESILTAPASESENGDLFGWSVCISGDVIGVGTYKNKPGYVFRRSGNSWAFESLTPVSVQHIDISGDQVAIVSFSGDLYLYDYPNGAWIHRYTSSPGLNSYYGDLYYRPLVTVENAVAATVTTTGTEGKSRQIQIFEKSGDAWQAQNLLEPPVTIAGERYGTSLAIEASSILVGAPNEGWSNPPPGNVYFYRTSYNNPEKVAAYVRKFLYLPDAHASILFPEEETAFRYKHLLYEAEDGQLRVNPDDFEAIFGSEEVSRSETAEAELRKGLDLSPDSDLLQDLLLDIYYDRTAALVIAAADGFGDTELIRHSPPSIPGSFVIEDEMGVYEQSLSNYRTALEGYISLLHDELGLGWVPPAGYQVFNDQVPLRALASAKMWSGSELVPVNNGPDPLFAGYKDLVLLIRTLRDYGRCEAEFARFLSPMDPERTESLLTEAGRFVYLHASLLEGLFPDLSMDDPALENSGYPEAVDALKVCLLNLENLRQQLQSGSDLLGFEDDFLMLVQKFAGQSSEVFDSFDALELRLDPGNLSSPLGYAIDLEQSARDTYADYRGFEEQLEKQLSNISDSLEDRLFQIAGAYPDSPDYANPENNEGCEMWLQLSSIEMAQLQIRRNRTEIRNLEEELRIEVERSQAVQDTMVSYGEQQASLTEWIGHINAAQAFADNMADAFSATSIRGALSSGANAAAQAAGEEAKGQIEAEKERLAAQERAEIEGIENAARIQTLMLGMNTLAIDSMEASLVLKQELGKLAALQREKEELERQLAESQSSLAERYFADPTHRLRQQHQTLLANLSFDEAQKWLYFMARSLEYKWNTPFKNYFYLGRNWSTGTLFKLRNAFELQQFYNAMVSFNSLVQLPQDDYFDWFSVREDFLGFIDEDDVGAPLLYQDPADPGGPPSLTAIEAFRAHLRSQMDSSGNIRLTFSTRRQIPGGTFYRGPRFAEDGSLLSAGLFLDKIKWLKINLPGNHTLGPTQIAGELAYGGTGFIRNFDVGTFAPDRPDRLQDEETAYSTRYWYFHAPSARWRFSESLSSPVTMQLSNDPEVPPTVREIDIFKERSVATTGWELTIPTQDLGVPLLDIDELDDIELYFYHYAVSRQVPVSAGSTEGAAVLSAGDAISSKPFPYNLAD